jgi:hypothetical protein
MSSISSSDPMSASAASSFVIPDVPRSFSSDRDDDDVDSLPSISSSILDSESEGSSDAQEEWEASLEQLQLLLTMIIMPFAGKFLGRKFAYWSRCPRGESVGLRRGLLADPRFVLQAGRGTWNGCIMSRSGGQTKRSSMPPARPRLRRRYDWGDSPAGRSHKYIWVRARLVGRYTCHGVTDLGLGHASIWFHDE